jgi:hypothetical protein
VFFFILKNLRNEWLMIRNREDDFTFYLTFPK